MSVKDDCDSAYAEYEPRPYRTMLEWALQNVSMPNGVPYDHDAYPHFGAPGGPCEAFDDPKVRTIDLQFASRLGKTAWALTAQMFLGDTNPCPMMFTSATEKLAKEIINTKYYPMLERCLTLREQLRPVARRKSDRIDFPTHRVFVAWARSPSTLADKAAKIIHANEIDKWEDVTTSKEGDPLKLLLERAKEFPGRKIIRESTPTIRGRSRIEAGLKGSTNCRYWVPCPHCWEFQKLKMWKEGEKGGLTWDKPAGATKSDPDYAYATARYVCEHCEGVIKDEHRARMCRHGVWVPDGCSVAKNGKIAGKSLKDGTAAGFQLSSLYALSLGWGDIVKEFLSCFPLGDAGERRVANPRLLQNFVNGWLGETWEHHKSKTLPEQLGDRLKGDVPRGTVPEWCRFLTVGVDKQGADGGFMPFVVLGWGEEERAALVEWGECETEEQLVLEVIQNKFPHEDKGHGVIPSITLIDSGYATKEVYAFCKDRVGVYPCKGMDSFSIDPYRIVIIGQAGSRPSRAASHTAIGQRLIHVNTDYWETEVQARLDDRSPGEPGSLVFCADAGRDSDLCEQLLNGAPADKVDSRGFGKLLWCKKDENIPNDLRDAFRYAMVGAKAYLDSRGGRIPIRSGVSKPQKVVVNAGATRPDGRPWI